MAALMKCTYTQNQNSTCAGVGSSCRNPALGGNSARASYVTNAARNACLVMAGSRSPQYVTTIILIQSQKNIVKCIPTLTNVFHQHQIYIDIFMQSLGITLPTLVVSGFNLSLVRRQCDDVTRLNFHQVDALSSTCGNAACDSKISFKIGIKNLGILNNKKVNSNRFSIFRNQR